MIPAWSLGVILLGYVFGFPVPFNSTQNDTRPEEPMQSWNETDSNSTLPMYNGPLRLKIERKHPVRCVVSLCALNNLGHELNRGGDESAGSATRDPHGNGKR